MTGRKKVEVTDQWLDSIGYTRERYESLSKSRRWALRNPEKQKTASTRWVADNPEKRRQTSRNYFLKRDYGITQADYDRMLEEQDGKCAGCGTDTPTGKWKVFAVDHCHHTGKVRGLLCNECNRGMGLLKDSAEIMQSLINYLQTNS